MGVWDWIREFRERAWEDGDTQRQELSQLLQEALEYNETEPDRALALLARGRTVAKTLNEPWWVLLFDHWRLQVLLHFKQDYRDVLDLAVQATVEARKPQYANLPQRVCLHEDLIWAYVGIDPVGHAGAIQQALDYMAAEVTPEVECRYCVQNCRTEFQTHLGRLDEARHSALHTLSEGDADLSRHTAEHHAVSAHCDLCDIAYRRRDWEGLREAALAGEEVARRRDRPRRLAELLAWQAVLARHDGDEDTARRRVRQAAARLGRLKAQPGQAYYDAVCAYHELGGELEQALEVRGRELNGLLNTGRHHYECRCRLRRCELLARLGRSLEPERTAAREAATKLRDPSRYLAELDRIAGEPAG
jgi:hypothetical protein